MTTEVQNAMPMIADVPYDWEPAKMVEVTLEHDDDFLIIKETLTRIGIFSKSKNTLTQTAHILQKKGKFYIVHFKELMLLDGRPSTLTVQDVARRNLIVSLLEKWGLCKVVNPSLTTMKAPIGAVRVLSHEEKGKVELVAKYTIGRGRRHQRREPIAA